MLKKTFKHNAESTAIDIKIMMDLKCINWVMPQLKAKHFSLLQQLDCALDEERRLNLSEDEQRAQQTLQQAFLQASHLAVLLKSNHSCWHWELLKNSLTVEINLKLKWARIFTEKLKQAADKVATESSEEEERGEEVLESSNDFDV